MARRRITTTPHNGPMGDGQRMTDRRAVVEPLVSFPMRLVTAALAASPEPPAPGEWSPTEIVRHLIAVEREVWPPRLDQLAHEAHPFWSWTEPGPWSGEPNASLDRLLEIFSSDRAKTLGLIEELGPDLWERHGTHETFGELDLAGLLAILVDHDEEHLASLGSGQDDAPE
jgi:DinB superfamily